MKRVVSHSSSLLHKSFRNGMISVLQKPITVQQSFRAPTTTPVNVPTASFSTEPTSQTTTNTPTTQQPQTKKDSKEEKTGFFSFAWKHRKYWLPLLAVFAAYKYYVSTQRDKIKDFAHSMIQMTEIQSTNLSEVFLLDQSDVEAIFEQAKKMAMKGGMIPSDVMGQLVYMQVLKRREERNQLRAKLIAEEFRIEREIKGEADPLPVLDNTHVADTTTNTSSGSSFWSYLGFGSTPAAPAAEPVPTLPTLEYAYEDWFDDIESDKFDIKTWTPLVVFGGLPSGSLYSASMINIVDAAIALSLITNFFVTPGDADCKHPLPVKAVHDAGIDITRLWEAFRHCLANRTDGYFNYFFKYDDKDYQFERVKHLIESTNNGDWTKLSPEDQRLLVERLQHIYYRNKLSYNFKRRFDFYPEKRLQFAWKIMGYGSSPITKTQFDALMRKLLISGHVAPDATYVQTKTWPVEFKTATSSQLASAYYTQLGKADDEKISVDEFVKAGKALGLMKQNHLWYMTPSYYTDLTDFEAWRLKIKTKLLGDQHVIDKY